MRMHHAGISVPDLDRSLAWYCAALGLRPGLPVRGAAAEAARRVRARRRRHRRGADRAGRIRCRGCRSSTRRRPMRCRASTTCASTSPTSTPAYARLLEHGAGAVWDPRDSPEPGMRMAYVTDPDGNLIELVAPRSAASRQAPRRRTTLA